MVERYMRDFVDAKYHLATAERMMKSYYDFEEKRFLVGVINEGARATSNLIRAYLIREGVRSGNAKKNFKIFMDKISKRYMDDLTRANLVKILEVQRAQKESPIEFARGDKIILLIREKYRFLTAERLAEFLSSIKVAVSCFGH